MANGLSEYTFLSFTNFIYHQVMTENTNDQQTSKMSHDSGERQMYNEQDA